MTLLMTLKMTLEKDIINVIKNPFVLSAFNPYYAYNLVANVDGMLGCWF